MAAENTDLVLKITNTDDLHVGAQAGKDDSSVEETKRSSAAVYYQLDNYIKTMTKQRLQELEASDETKTPPTLGSSDDAKGDKNAGKKSKAQDNPSSVKVLSLNPLLASLQAGSNVQNAGNQLMIALGMMSSNITAVTTEVTQMEAQYVSDYQQYGNTDGVGDKNVRGKEETCTIKKEGDNYDVFDADGHFCGQLQKSELNSENVLKKLKGDSTGDITAPESWEKYGEYNDDHLKKLHDGKETSVAFTYYDTSKGTSYAPGGIDAIENGPGDTSEKSIEKNKFMAFMQAVQASASAANTQANTLAGVPTMMETNLTQSNDAAQGNSQTILQALSKVSNMIASLASAG
ncbi:MAG: hypothetical protein S4CHLAM20_07470 [Chlamydiia bacterium]|nr:hypothetical protein [Chlamydiia bacterium]